MSAMLTAINRLRCEYYAHEKRDQWWNIVTMKTNVTPLTKRHENNKNQLEQSVLEIGFTLLQSLRDKMIKTQTCTLAEMKMKGFEVSDYYWGYNFRFTPEKNSQTFGALLAVRRNTIHKSYLQISLSVSLFQVHSWQKVGLRIMALEKLLAYTASYRKRLHLYKY